MYDVTDKSNPILLTRFPHQPGYSHNSELSADGKILFVSVETSNQPLASFDVSNLDDIRLLALYKPSKKPSGEVHNVRIMPGNFLVCPSYRGQLTVVDASRPGNMIEIAWDSLGNSLVWDADPYLPSGIILATAKSEGLYIYQTNYQHAAWLEGMVTDQFSGVPLANARVFVLNTPNADTTLANGEYQTGAAQSGNYAVRVEREGYETQVHTNIALSSGIVTTKNFTLKPLIINTEQPNLEHSAGVSPIPFSSYLQIAVPDHLPTSGWQLCSLNGEILRTIPSQSSNLIRIEQLDPLPNGTYLLQNIHSGTSLKVVKH
ncbi:MAG TPA: hypothetical protein DCF33_01195 [Saprospirales bacterium]|nr:hypothetical protein [Saprospirales bacterium]